MTKTIDLAIYTRRKDVMGTLLLLAATIALLGACSLAPEYRRPPAPVPDAWQHGPADRAAMAAPATAAEPLPWREYFTDPELQRVIETALANNRDLRLAALNVERARAIYGIQRAELLPSVNAVGAGSQARIPADLSASGKAVTAEQYDVSLGISAWELDLFGRIRSLRDRALEEYLATAQARNAAQIMLISATAQAYLLLAADRENLSTARATLESQEGIYNLIGKRYQAGLASDLELSQARGQADATRVEVARWTQIVAKNENALQLLTGAPLPSAMPAALGSVRPPAELSPGLSSEILQQRPDILAAEHRLKAAHANIGAARAAFFPRISLTAALGTASAELSGLFAAGSGTWSFAPRVILPVFDARIWAASRVSQAERDIALTQYERAIQVAFREVADALAIRGTVEEQLAAQKALAASAEETHRIALIRYKTGIDSYLSVLDAKRTLYGARQGLTSLQLALLVNRITLYGVLGGGGASP